MKKKLVLVFVLFLMTGCSVDYTLKFHDNVISETIDIDATSTNMTDTQIKTMLEDQMDPNEESPLYQVKQKNKKITLSQKYTTKTYQNSPLLRQCYTAYNFIEDDHYYDLTTSETFSCNPFDYMYIDILQIKIKTNHKVLLHNADTVIHNTYIWNITKENAENKPIQIRFSKETKPKYLVLIIFGISAIISVFIVTVVFVKKKTNNKI